MIGHVNGTVARYNPRSQSLVHFSGEQTGISGQVCNIASQPDGSLWFATASGLYRFEEATFVNYLKADGLPNEIVSASAVARDGSVWFAKSVTPSGFVSRVKPEVKQAGRSPFETVGPGRALASYSLAPDAKGGVWIVRAAQGAPLLRFDAEAESRGAEPFSSFEPPYGQKWVLLAETNDN